jgi:dTDP-4-dehydrorhamnose reductase
MRTLLFGATSMPGYSLYSARGARDVTPFCSPHVTTAECQDWPRINLEDPTAYPPLFSQNPPDVLIHCGGICDVDKCEEDPAWAERINVTGVKHLLKVLPKQTRLVYLSSDHVFGGRDQPYAEDTPPDPISVYGESRLAAEKLIAARGGNTLIVRYALGIGPSYNGRGGHLNWMQYRTSKKLPLTVYTDEYRSAVWAKDLAARLYAYCDSGITGLRHISATHAVSREELAKAIDQQYAVGASFTMRSKSETAVPHLGRVELQTIYQDELAAPLPSPVRQATS